MQSERKAEGKFIINGAKIQLKVQRYKEEDSENLSIFHKNQLQQQKTISITISMISLPQ